jgi:hypothetical protein
MRIMFQGVQCELKFGRYSNGRTAIQVTFEGQPMLIATVNIPGWPLDTKSEVFIKDWSENNGILEVLEEAGIVQRSGLMVPSGHVEAVGCYLLVEPPPETP